VSALEYHEAAWEAHDLEGTPPDPLLFSDSALQAIVKYQTRDLPVDAFEAVERELSRRRLSTTLGCRVLGLVMLALLAMSGLVIGWILLVP